jgi:pimeloyl-ACP methyl ester carboxylesterase
MENRHQLLALRDGGQIAYDEYGDPNGTPVFFCHGWPSSRTMAEFTHAAGRDLGVRIISPDRPGIRGSSFQAARKLIDWPLVLEQLAQHLGIDRFRMLAISGGAPYAYVTGWAMRERVRAMAIVSGAPPIAELSDQSDLWAFYRWMLHCYTRYPRFSRWGFRFARPFLSLRAPRRTHPMLLKLLPPSDAAALRDSRAFDICFESQREAWRASALGVLADAEIYARPWGFALEDVDVPVRLWHGKEDRAFAFRLAEEVAQRLPNCTARYVDKTGHYSLPIRHMHEILADLISV